jgi:hypothetical protein
MVEKTQSIAQFHKILLSGTGAQNAPGVKYLQFFGGCVCNSIGCYLKSGWFNETGALRVRREILTIF